MTKPAGNHAARRADRLKNLATVGIVTALEHEYLAVQVMLDNPVEYQVPGRGASRRYCLGEIAAADHQRHVVVLTLTPVGTNAAAARAVLLLEHFPSVEWIFMVGIAGGVPNPNKVEEHVRLGDVVISNQKGVVQYDFVKEEVGQTSRIQTFPQVAQCAITRSRALPQRPRTKEPAAMA